MTNLEAKDKMSPIQLAIVVATVIIAIHSDMMVDIFADAGTASWISVLIAGGCALGAALLMVELGDFFPGQTLIEYMPLLWGKWLGFLNIAVLVTIFFLDICYVLQGFSRLISFFMFDRTPYEVIELGMLMACVYCALQDWGTILRVIQVVFFTAVPTVLIFLGLSMTSFRFINIHPLWPQQARGVLAGVPNSWELFCGYEIILLLLPQVYRGKTKVSKALVGSFAFGTIFFLFLTILTIGVLGIDSSIKTAFPIYSVLRSIDIPGTYLERIDNYYLLAWIQVIFIMFSIELYVIARTFKRYGRFSDHRPWVLAITPILFIGADALHSSRLFEMADKALTWLGISFSFGIIPVSYGLAWWKMRDIGNDADFGSKQ